MSALGNHKGLAHLAAILVVLPLLAWQFSLGNTIRMWREASRLEKELTALRLQAARSGDSPTSLFLRDREHIRDGELLGDILCGPGCCEVVRYVPYSCPAADGLTLHTAEVTVNTDYLSLVRMADHIERRMPECRLQSVSLRSVTPRGSREVQLHATFIIQQIVKNP